MIVKQVSNMLTLKQQLLKQWGLLDEMKVLQQWRFAY